MKIFNLLDTNYNKFTNAVKTYLTKSLNGYDTKYGNATIFGQLLNVVNAAVQNVMLYIEDAFIEQNKYTAQRKKSIYNLAALSGYEPGLGKAAAVQLNFTFVPNNSNSTNIVIHNHERLVCTQNGLTYNIVLPQEAVVLAIDQNSGKKVLQAVQGRFETQTFISTGGKYYTINLQYNGNLDVDYIKVKVNGKEWDRKDSFYDMQSNSEQYICKSGFVGGADIIFGNNVHGRSLKTNDIIEVTYLVHDGELGNLDTQTETYFIFDNPVYDNNGNELDGNSIFNVTFASIDSVTAGTDSETKEQVRQMIGRNSRSLILATPDNYKSFINKFSFCGYNRTWSEKGSLIVNSMIIKNFKKSIDNGSDYFNLNTSDFILSDSQKSSLLNCIENSGAQLGGVSYNIIDPVIRKYALYIYIKLKSNKLDKEYIKAQVKELVGDFFSNIHSDIFIPKSDIIQLIKNNISEVDGVDAYFLSERNETAMRTGHYIDTIYTYDPSIGSYKTSSQNIYVYPGESPNLGLDAHGNIYLNSNIEFPVLLGGWDFTTENNQSVKASAITITIE